MHTAQDVLSVHEERVRSGVLRPDERQRAVAVRLGQLHDQILGFAPQLDAYVAEREAWTRRFNEIKRALTQQHQQRFAELQALAAAPATSSSTASDVNAKAVGEESETDAGEDVFSNRPEAPDVLSQSRAATSPSSPVPPSAEQRGLFEYLSSSLWPSTGPSPSSPPKEDPRAKAREELAALEQDIERRAQDGAGPLPTAPSPPRGVYLHGSVGSGKSMLTDSFYLGIVGALGDRIKAKRVHFNAAMLDVNELMHRYEQERLRGESEKLEALVKAEEERHDKSGEGVVGAFMKALLIFERDKARQQRAKIVAARRRQREVRSRDTVSSALELSKSNAEVFHAVALSLLGWSKDDLKYGIAPKPTLLLWDEIQVNDPFTCIALKGILENLMQLGAVLVFTSNRPQTELNRHGLHEDLFQGFITRLLNCTDSVSLDSDIDYRFSAFAKLEPLEASATATQLKPFERLFLYPVNPTTDAAFEAMWAACPSPEEPRTLPVAFGRTLTLQRTKGGAARVTFEELCATTTGAADYIALARTFDTLFMEGVPHLSFSKRDQARRFITLIDELYNHQVRLIVTAPSEPERLFTGTERDEPIFDLEQLQFETAAEGSRSRRNLTEAAGVAPVLGAASKADKLKVQALLGGMEERFAFRRAISRLWEMQRPLYLETRARTGN